MIEYISSHFQSSLFLIHEAFPPLTFDCADYRKMSDSEDEQEAQQPEDPVDGSSSEADDSAALAGDIVKVWDGGKMIQTVDGEGKKIMKCLHGCGGVWKSWNHTKALGHVLGGCSDIKQCRFVTKRASSGLYQAKCMPNGWRVYSAAADLSYQGNS